TLRGLSKHMLGVSTLETLEALAQRGDLARIDLTVRDIAGGPLGDLPPGTTASNFGKITADATAEDKALAIMNMIVEAVSVLSLAAARASGLQDIVLTGKLTRVFRFMQRQKRLALLGRFTIPEHADYATAIGAAQGLRAAASSGLPGTGVAMASELLSGFRMLDLTDERGALCGKIFADLGADVVKVEPPSGCPTRRIPPFLDDQPGPDRGLYSIAYQAGKRSVTLNLESADGRALLEDLARKSDFLVESFAPGYMDSLGLGYERLAELNPRLIYASITPFGDSGPARNYKAADIVSWASGGPMFMMGEKGRPPLEMSVPQAGLHAG